MYKLVKGILFWTPRVLGGMFLLLLGLSSLDVFAMGAGFWETVVAFLAHNIPVFLLLAFYLPGLRWEWVAGVGFLLFAAWYRIFSPGESPVTYLLLAGIPALVGMLFLAGWVLRKQLRR